MADDGVGAADPVQMSLVDRVSWWDAVNLYFSAATLCLCGPVMLACTVFGGAELLLMGVVFTVIFLPVGLGLWFHTNLEREHNRRLDAVGVPATAEILDLTDFEWNGEESGVLVELRISGPGLRTFETTWKRTHHPALRVGLWCKAVVDPAGGRFRVEL
ncbi:MULTISPECIES: hypothetical protein [unclassified Streptomyces]|uniref:hypothetical protein n=1 Tax=unclassified Streptomyces TaxID=2593676 RepID=UPI00190D2B3C|nr:MULTISPECIES: hypothetical protein [unclassified Streptomyces]MBK3566258.1 hypothetical protein [Streptomyces sp. MBT62]MBK6011036.1 hypothetical protein [Streptomyces sp. MBT53]